jgi:hypothetical protein
MGDVVSIFRGMFLGDYSALENPDSLDDKLFVLGVLATIVAPQAIYMANGGPIPPLVFVVCAAIGTIGGLVKYDLSSIDMLSIVRTETELEQSPQRNAPKRRKRS